MTVSSELVWLLNQLRNTPRPLERLRLVARGYRALLDLPPTDRRRLAAELGFDGAEQLVEQLARKGGVSPARLLEVLKRAESADPDTLAGLVRGLVDPERRPSLVEHVLDGAVDWLAGESSEEEAGREPDPTPAGPSDTLAEAPDAAWRDAEESARDLREGAERATTAGEVGEESAVSGADAEQVPSPPPTPSPRRAAPPARAPGRGPVHPPPPRRAAAAAVAPGRGPTPREASASETEARPEATSRPELTPSEAGAADRTWLVRRLRRVARQTGELTGAGLADLDRLLEGFPSGWARRRVLEALLRAGVPRRIDEALLLVGRLGSPGERMWALTTLAASRELDDDERERLEAAAGSPVLARRLRLRMRRA